MRALRRVQRAGHRGRGATAAGPSVQWGRPCSRRVRRAWRAAVRPSIARAGSGGALDAGPRGSSRNRVSTPRESAWRRRQTARCRYAVLGVPLPTPVMPSDHRTATARMRNRPPHWSS